MTYVSNIRIALLLFPLLAALFTVPYLIYQYRKFGSIPWWKTVLVFAFIFYLMCAYFMVILPLPADRTAFVASAAHPQLVPFEFVRDIAMTTSLNPTSPASWLRWVKSPTVYVTLFNVLLTMPFGGFLRYFFHRKWWQVLLMGFGFSLFFEVSQLTGLFGLYEHPYRLFDVDDLIVNTTGAMVGFWVSIPLTFFLPNIDRMNEQAIIKGEHHTAFLRRLLAFGIDMSATVVVSRLLMFAIPSLDGGRLSSLAQAMLSTGITFMLIPVLTRGRTLGHLALKLRVVRPDGTSARWYSYVLRYMLLLWVFWLAPTWMVLLVPAPSVLVAGADEYAVAASMLGAITFVAQAVWLLSVLVRAIMSAFGKPFVMLNGVMTNTRVMAEAQIERLRADRL